MIYNSKVLPRQNTKQQSYNNHVALPNAQTQNSAPSATYNTTHFPIVFGYCLYLQSLFSMNHLSYVNSESFSVTLKGWGCLPLQYKFHILKYARSRFLTWKFEACTENNNSPNYSFNDGIRWSTKDSPIELYQKVGRSSVQPSIYFSVFGALLDSQPEQQPSLHILSYYAESQYEKL